MSAVRQETLRASVLALTAIVVGTATMLLGTQPAWARTRTLHFFSEAVMVANFRANGQPISLNAQQTAGGYFESYDVDYAGDNNKHAGTATASDSLVCTYVTSSTEICDWDMAVGGSLLLASHVRVSKSTQILTINGGTGKFNGAKGTLDPVEIGDTADYNYTVTFSK